MTRQKIIKTIDENNDWLYKNMTDQNKETYEDITMAERHKRRMTVIEYLDKLAGTKRTWKLTESGRIIDNHGTCPHSVLRESNLDAPFKGPGAISTKELCRAAMNSDGHNPKVRKALLQACGLTEKPTR